MNMMIKAIRSNAIVIQKIPPSFDAEDSRCLSRLHSKSFIMRTVPSCVNLMQKFYQTDAQLRQKNSEIAFELLNPYHFTKHFRYF